MNYLIDHPEKLDDEIFLGNFKKTEEIDFKTKRYGVVPYSSSGEPLFGLLPVFIRKREVKDKIQKLKNKIYNLSIMLELGYKIF